jgi:uncharacterized membrane protein
MRHYVVLVIFLCSVFAFSYTASAEELHQELQETVRADVITIEHEEEQIIAGTATGRVVQEVQVKILSGEKKHDIVSFENDLMRLKVGDRIYVNRLVTIDGIEYYTFKDADRHFVLITLGCLFVVVLILFAGLHGVRALVSVALSISVLFLILVPLILKGYAPLLVCTVTAGLILGMTLYLTHGIYPRTHIAFLGTVGAVLVTSIIAHIWVRLAHFTGLSSDEAIYLNFSTQGTLDFGGILLGSIIIGILGILDDVSVTQASIVLELKRANQALGLRELYTRGIRVGRDHIGSLVNTLALVYVGTSLPLVLLLVAANSDLILSINQEIVAVELVRIFIGSIGLILAVPLTTFIAAWWYDTYGIQEDGIAHTHIHSV